jgi:hypothetical protein
MSIVEAYFVSGGQSQTKEKGECILWQRGHSQPIKAF